MRFILGSRVPLAEVNPFVRGASQVNLKFRAAVGIGDPAGKLANFLVQLHFQTVATSLTGHQGYFNVVHTRRLSTIFEVYQIAHTLVVGLYAELPLAVIEVAVPADGYLVRSTRLDVTTRGSPCINR